MPVIFISYRRSDSQDVTGRIYDRLVGKFTQKQVLKDVDNIPLGVSFPMHLQQMIGKANVVLVIIGPGWLTATDEQGNRRLDDPADFVRVEVESALRANMPVIPVLVSNAPMPKVSDLPKSMQKLAERNGMAVRPDPDFNNDIGRLFTGIEHLDKLLKPPFGKAGKGQKEVIPTVLPVDDEKIVVEVVREAPIKKKEPAGRSQRDRERPPRAKAPPEGLVCRFTSCAIGGTFSGLLVLGGLVAVGALINDHYQKTSIPMFLLMLAVGGLVGAVPGFLGGTLTACLPRKARHPIVLPFLWAPIVGAIPLVYPLAYQELPSDFAALLAVVALLGAAYGLMLGLLARLLEYGVSGYFGLLGIVSLFVLVSVVSYGGVVYMSKAPAKIAESDDGLDTKGPFSFTPIKPINEPKPKPEPIKGITVHVSSQLGAFYQSEVSTVTIDGIRQTISLSKKSGNERAEVNFRLKGPGTYNYSLSTFLTPTSGKSRIGTGSGLITFTEDATYDLQMNNRIDGGLDLSLRRRLGGGN